MKKPFLITILALGLAVSLFESCQKYPDGPWISFRTKEERVSGTWYLDHFYLNGSDATAAQVAFLGNTYSLNIFKDGTYQAFGNYPETGTCSFADDQTNFYFQNYSTGTVQIKYKILKLEYTALWLTRTNSSGDVEQWRFIAYR